METNSLTASAGLAAGRARFIREALPPGGLLAGLEWRISPEPFPLAQNLAREIESLGRVVLQFYRAVNLLYRKSVAGQQPEWVARWLDLGKPAELIAWQRSPAFKNDVPRVIRPDLLLTDNGLRITELDSVPGGIGLTAWLNQTYSHSHSALRTPRSSAAPMASCAASQQLLRCKTSGLIVVSEEAATYKPEMVWLAEQLNAQGRSTFTVQPATFNQFAQGDAVYRFFELFDLANVSNARRIFEVAAEKKIRPNATSQTGVRREAAFCVALEPAPPGFLAPGIGRRLLHPAPTNGSLHVGHGSGALAAQGAIPELNLTDWRQLKTMSQKERELILKVSGFSEHAWGARGVFLGSDLSDRGLVHGGGGCHPAVQPVAAACFSAITNRALVDGSMV